jgi:hypothetical protein
MMYIVPPLLKQLKRDIATFIAGSRGPATDN